MVVLTVMDPDNNEFRPKRNSPISAPRGAPRTRTTLGRKMRCKITVRDGVLPSVTSHLCVGWKGDNIVDR